jgi:LysR family transcriptional regulator of abg operon
MTLQQIRAFLAVVEFGSFRRAARELGISQAGLTGSLQALEASFGVAVLERSTRGVTLTNEGERLLPHAQLIERECQKAHQEVSQGVDNLEGTLHVGMGPTPTAVLLPLVVPDFHARFPAVQLKLVSGFYEQLRPALQRGLIELAVTTLPPEGVSPQLQTKHLFWSNLVVVGRHDHPHRHAASLEQLVNCEWILLGAPGRAGSSILRLYTERGLPAPRIAATCETFTQLAALMHATNWLALIPDVVVQSGQLGIAAVPFALPANVKGSDNSVVYRSDVPLTRAAESFAIMCQSCARIVTKLGAGAKHPHEVKSLI